MSRTTYRKLLLVTLIAVAVCGVVCALILWRAAVTDPLAQVPVLNPWGIERVGREPRSTVTHTVQLVSDEGKIWLVEDSARVEFQLLTDSREPFGLPLRLELRRNPLRDWEIGENSDEHYASLPIIPPAGGRRSAAASCPPPGQPSLEAALALAAEDRRNVQANDCVLLANMLASRIQGCGIVARHVSAWANPQNSLDAHSLLEVYSPEHARWILIDPTFVGYYADVAGNPVSASEAYHLSVQAVMHPDAAQVQFKPLPGALSRGTVNFATYYLSPITMLRYMAIEFGSQYAVLGAVRLPHAGANAFFIPPEIQVSKGVFPPIIEYRISDNQLAWRIGRETSGLVQLTCEGGVVSDGGMMNPDLVSPQLVSLRIWSTSPRKPGGDGRLGSCNMEWVREDGSDYLRLSSDASPARVRIDFETDAHVTYSFRTRIRALTPGIGLEYFGFLPLFGTQFPVRPGNWRIETTPFCWASTGRVSLVLHLPPHGALALRNVVLISAERDTSQDQPRGFSDERKFRMLVAKRNLRSWIIPRP